MLQPSFIEDLLLIFKYVTVNAAQRLMMKSKKGAYKRDVLL
jgi:hypothetical protein